MPKIGQRQGGPTRAVKKKQYLPSLASKETRKHWLQYLKSGRKYNAARANIHASHRLSDKSIRHVYGKFLDLATEDTKRVTSDRFRFHVNNVTSSIWNSSEQTKRQNNVVNKGIEKLYQAFDENRFLVGSEARAYARAIKTLANSSHRNIRAGHGGANMSIGAAVDHGVMYSPKGKNLVNTPITRGIRRSVEWAERYLKFDRGELANFRVPKSRSSQYETGYTPRRLKMSPYPDSPSPSAPTPQKKRRIAQPASILSPAPAKTSFSPNALAKTSQVSVSSSHSQAPQASTSIPAKQAFAAISSPAQASSSPRLGTSLGKGSHSSSHGSSSSSSSSRSRTAISPAPARTNYQSFNTPNVKTGTKAGPTPAAVQLQVYSSSLFAQARGASPTKYTPPRAWPGRSPTPMHSGRPSMPPVSTTSSLTSSSSSFTTPTKPSVPSKK